VIFFRSKFFGSDGRMRKRPLLLSSLLTATGIGYQFVLHRKKFRLHQLPTFGYCLSLVYPFSECPFTFVQNVHRFLIRPSTLGFCPEATNPVTQELATRLDIGRHQRRNNPVLLPQSKISNRAGFNDISPAAAWTTFV
jgi:hypothetical protein